jgi:hypothetical protein
MPLANNQIAKRQTGVDLLNEEPEWKSIPAFFSALSPIS